MHHIYLAQLHILITQHNTSLNFTCNFCNRLLSHNKLTYFITVFVSISLIKTSFSTSYKLDAFLLCCSPPSFRILSCWFLRSPPLPMAECGSCSSSPVALRASTASGGRRWKEETSMLKSLLELCPRAAKTGQEEELFYLWLKKNT